jgi:hypothetical protein
LVDSEGVGSRESDSELVVDRSEDVRWNGGCVESLVVAEHRGL